VAVYVIMGGMKGVMYTDASKEHMLFGMIVLIIFTYTRLEAL
jgi:SSS family solute:Na+ symporter